MSSNKHDHSRLELKLLRKMGRTIREYGLIEDGDRVLVALSGGKDSYALLVLLDKLRKRAPINYELVPWHLDQVQPGYDGAPLVNWLADKGWDNAVIARQDTYSIVTDKLPAGSTYCSLCSRLRRGILYNAAVELGCTRIALGHHADDTIETAMMNLMFTGSLKAMPPFLRSDDGRNTVIRPMIRIWENDLIAYAEEQQFPILPCNLCGSQDGLKRQAVKALFANLQVEHPGCKESFLAALQNVVPGHLFDLGLWQTLGIAPESAEPTPRGSKRLHIAS